MTVSLRHFAAEDAPVLREKLWPDMTLEALADMIGEWNTLTFEGRYFEMFAVQSGDRVVGTVSLYEHTASVVSLGAEIFEGERRKGHAAAASALALERAAARGWRIAQDQVRADNAASIRLHEALGFETDGYVYRNQRGQEVLLYLKAL